MRADLVASNIRHRAYMDGQVKNHEFYYDVPELGVTDYCFCLTDYQFSAISQYARRPSPPTPDERATALVVRWGPSVSTDRTALARDIAAAIRDAVAEAQERG